MKRQSIIQEFPICVALIFVILISGCATATTRMYTGEALPKEKIAVIKGNKRFLFVVFAYVQSGVRIREVDGRLLLPPTEKCEVLPGLHDVVVEAYSKGGMGTFLLTPFSSYFRVSFKFNTEAGHQYRIKVPSLTYKGALVKVKDTKSGEIVGSQPIEHWMSTINGTH